MTHINYINTNDWRAALVAGCAFTLGFAVVSLAYVLGYGPVVDGVCK